MDRNGVLKEGTLWDFLNVHYVAKYKKNESGDPLEALKISRKVSHCRKIF